MWWGLTGEVGPLDAHDAAVTAMLDHPERFGSTTRIRRDGGRLHPDSQGLTMGTFRQTTSRADDPQIHTHAVISEGADHRWSVAGLGCQIPQAASADVGSLHQSALRSELTAGLGVAWSEIINGQAEIVGIPGELRALFSKRSSQVEAALDDKVVVPVFKARAMRVSKVALAQFMAGPPSPSPVGRSCELNPTFDWPLV